MNNPTPSNRSVQVVGFSDHRPSKIANPLSALDNQSRAITLRIDSRSPVDYLRVAHEGWTALRNTSFDVIVADDFGVITVMTVLLARVFRTPVLVRAGGNPLLAKRERIRESARDWSAKGLLKHVVHLLVIKFVLAVVTGCIVVSSELKRELAKEFGWSPEQFVVVPVPISPEEYRPDDYFHYEVSNGSIDGSTDVDDVSTDDFRSGQEVLTVTNLKFEAKYEGLVDAAEAMAQVLENNDDTSWTVAGGGRYLERFCHHIDEEYPAVCDRVRTPGFVTNVDVLYARADVFLYISYLDGYPNVVLEAQSAGLPVIANPAYGMLEQIEDGTSGLFVNPKNSDDVAQVVRRLLENPDRRRKLGAGGRERVRRENTPRSVGVRLHVELSKFLDRLK